MDEKIIPTCKYGHGNLERQNAGEEKGQLFSVDTFPRRNAPGFPLGTHVVYSFAVFKCPKCSYLELHDVVLDQNVNF